MNSLEQVIGVQLASHASNHLNRTALFEIVDKFTGDPIVAFTEQGLIDAKELLAAYIQGADADEPMWQALAQLLAYTLPEECVAAGAGSNIDAVRGCRHPLCPALVCGEDRDAVDAIAPDLLPR